MYHHTTTLTTTGVEKLRAQFDALKARYKYITQELKDKTQSHNILAVKSIEKEIILSDMRKVETILSHAITLEKGDAPIRADQGTKVTYRQQDTGREHVIILVDPLEADPLEGFVSVKSPVGSMLLGREVGDLVEATAPKGVMHLVITGLE